MPCFLGRPPTRGADTESWRQQVAVVADRLALVRDPLRALLSYSNRHDQPRHLTIRRWRECGPSCSSVLRRLGTRIISATSYQSQRSQAWQCDSWPYLACWRAVRRRSEYRWAISALHPRLLRQNACARVSDCDQHQEWPRPLHVFSGRSRPVVDPFDISVFDSTCRCGSLTARLGELYTYDSNDLGVIMMIGLLSLCSARGGSRASDGSFLESRCIAAAMARSARGVVLGLVAGFPCRSCAGERRLGISPRLSSCGRYWALDVLRRAGYWRRFPPSDAVGGLQTFQRRWTLR